MFGVRDKRRKENTGPVLQIRYDSEAPHRSVILPVSKSIRARDLILRAAAGLAPDEHSFDGWAEDNRILAEALREDLKREDENEHFISLDLGQGGTALRFISALIAALPGIYDEIKWHKALMRRPLAPLVDALKSLGAYIDYTETPGYPPLYIRGQKLRGGEVAVAGNISSQFASALLMVAPLWENGLKLRLDADRISGTYIEMTLKMMARYGIAVTKDANTLTVSPGRYHISAPYIEGDWSAAGYFYEAALLAPDRDIVIENLAPPESSLQGDAVTQSIFNFLGVSTARQSDGTSVLRGDSAKIDILKKSGFPVELNLSETPDIVPALSVGLAVAGIPFHLSGLGHLRFKESDRLTALAVELQKIGCAVEAGADYIAGTGRLLPSDGSDTIETYDDHRIAMALAVTAARRPDITMRNYDVVAKSFGDFFTQIQKIGYYFFTPTRHGLIPRSFEEPEQ